MLKLMGKHMRKRSTFSKSQNIFPQQSNYKTKASYLIVEKDLADTLQPGGKVTITRTGTNPAS